MIENGPRTTESTIEQQECEITEEINETFDFIDYAKLVTAEMLEQLENNKNKDQPLDNIDSLVITNPRHPEIEIGQIYKDKATLKSVLSYFAITNHFQYKVFKSCSREYNIICLDKNCKWSIRASRNGTTQAFIIRKYYKIHTCSLEIRSGDQ